MRKTFLGGLVELNDGKWRVKTHTVSEDENVAFIEKMIVEIHDMCGPILIQISSQPIVDIAENLIKNWAYDKFLNIPAPIGFSSTPEAVFLAGIKVSFERDTLILTTNMPFYQTYDWGWVDHQIEKRDRRSRGWV